jgi:copper transport protein
MRVADGIVGVALALILNLAPWTPAFAHAALVRAEPADGAVLAQPPPSLKLIFNEPVSPLVMRIIGPAGELMAPASVSTQDRVVTIVPPRLPQGTSVLSWRVVSADGHPIGGSLLFAVGAASAVGTPGGIDTDPALKLAIWAGKLVLYLGLFIGIGGAAFRALVAQGPPLPMSARRAIAAVIGAGLVAAVALVALQGLDALALPLAQVWQPQVLVAGLRTAFGLTAAVSVVALLLGLAAMRVPSQSPVKLFALAALAGTGAALAVSGHAGTAEPRVITEPSVFLHAVAVAFWIGALLPLLVLVRAAPQGDASLRRFSRAIPLALVALAASGLYLAFVQLDRLDALWTTDYGRVLSAKLGLILALLALAGANRYRLVPRFEARGMRASRPLAASIAVEIGIAVVILGVVALWRFTPPPRALAAGEPIAFHIHDPKAMINAALAPRRGQGAALDILVMDNELRPLTVKEVTLVVSFPAAGIEPVHRSATDTGDSHWTIADLRIPIAGRWDVRVDILVDDFEKVVLEDKIDLPRAP